jgi:hypothetical protein
MAEYVGRYVVAVNADTIRLDVSVAQDGKTLGVYDARTGRTVPLAPVGPDAFVGLEGAGAWSFERTGDASSPVRAIVNGAGPNRRVLVKQ